LAYALILFPSLPNWEALSEACVRPSVRLSVRLSVLHMPIAQNGQFLSALVPSSYLSAIPSKLF